MSMVRKRIASSIIKLVNKADSYCSYNFKTERRHEVFPCNGIRGIRPDEERNPKHYNE